MMKTPLKGLISVPKVQTNGPINARLVSFGLTMVFDEVCPLMLSDNSIRSLRKLLFLACPSRASLHKV